MDTGWKERTTVKDIPPIIVYGLPPRSRHRIGDPIGLVESVNLMDNSSNVKPVETKALAIGNGSETVVYEAGNVLKTQRA